MELESAFVSLGVALGVGLLVGFEREQSAGAEGVNDRATMGGVRTYPLVSLAGALSTLLAREIGAWFVAVVFAAVATLVAVSYADDVRRDDEHGLTSETAMLLTFLLGALAPADGIIASAKDRAIVLFSVAVVVTLVLSMKPALHALVHKTTKDDVYATLKFLLVAVVVLPLLPDRNVGPLDVFNPYRTGLLIVFIAGVGFVGYVCVRVLGAGRGLGLTGLVGGLVSSTAVTLVASRRARKTPGLAPACTLSVVLASTVLAPRVLVVVAVIDPNLAQILAPPVVALAAVGAAVSWFLWRHAKHAPGESGGLQVVNPFELSSAVKLGLLITVVLFATKAAVVRFGTGGVYAASAIAGSADVDPITVSMAHMAHAQIEASVAATAILIAVAANTIAKTALAAVVGGWAFGRTLVLFCAATTLAAALGVAWVWR